MNLNIKRLYIHDREGEEATVTKTRVTSHKDEVHYAVRGTTIGEVVNQAKGWLSEETQTAIAMATATVRSIIVEELLKLDSMRSWIDKPDCIKVAMASQTLYIYLDRPCEGKVSLMPADLSGWAPVINTRQDWFEIGEPWFLSGGYEGCTLQMKYKLLKNDVEIAQ